MVDGSPRLGACVGRVGKFICIGLNYADHAAESGLQVPPEPVIFMKATSAVCGPTDDVEIPRGSEKTDWEVELGVVIGKAAKYVTEAEASAYCKEQALPIIGCCCPACGDLSLQRQRVKRLISELDREHPGVKASMIRALSNVKPRHLLDRRLNPPAAASLTASDVDIPAELPSLVPFLLNRGS